MFDRWWPRVRDVGCAIFGGYHLNNQFQQEHPNTMVATIAAMLLVVPAASLAQRWLRGKIEE